MICWTKLHNGHKLNLKAKSILPNSYNHKKYKHWWLYNVNIYFIFICYHEFVYCSWGKEEKWPFALICSLLPSIEKKAGNELPHLTQSLTHCPSCRNRWTLRVFWQRTQCWASAHCKQPGGQASHTELRWLPTKPPGHFETHVCCVVKNRPGRGRKRKHHHSKRARYSTLKIWKPHISERQTFSTFCTLIFLSSGAGLTGWVALLTHSIIWRLNKQHRVHEGGGCIIAQHYRVNLGPKP